MAEDAQNAEQGIKEELKHYRRLQAIADTDEFKDYFDLLKRTVADKMLWAFSAGKDGDNIKNWEDFCKLRGEIVARLQPIQEVYGAEDMINFLLQQLDTWYKKKV